MKKERLLIGTEFEDAYVLNHLMALEILSRKQLFAWVQCIQKSLEAARQTRPPEDIPEINDCYILFQAWNGSCEFTLGSQELAVCTGYLDLLI